MKQEPSETVSLPGDFLSTAEEFSPGAHTFARKGKVRSAVLGKAQFDTQTRTVSVAPRKKKEYLQVGDTVIAEVQYIRKNMVVVTMLQAESQGRKKVFGRSQAVILISEAGRNFIRDLRQEYKTGDFLKAKVSGIKPWNVQLRCNEAGLGAIKAYCSQCRGALQLFDQSLKCLRCGAAERRNVSSDYILQ